MNIQSTGKLLSIILSCFFALFTTLHAESINLSVEKETTFGQSVYAGADHPLLGSGDITQALKLSPHDYPVWQAAVDLPPGLELQVNWYVRQDAPASAGDTNNFTLFGTDTLATSPTTQVARSIYLYTADESATAQLIIMHPRDLSVIESIDMSRESDLLYASVPPEHINNGRVYRIQTNTGNLPASSVSRLQDSDQWWRFGQAFLYNPVSLAQAPAAARVETFAFIPSGFASRTIRVLLPRNYDVEQKSYPVLYAEDGQNVFAPGGPFGSWDMDIIAKGLIARGDIPEFILVGIDNTSARLAEYTPEYTSVQGTAGRGGEYLIALRDGLLPEINSRYRTLTGPQYTSHIGSSLGGLIGYHAANEFEAAWGSVAAMSTAFWIGLEENLARAALPENEFARLYIDSGNAGTSNDDYWNTYNIRDKLIENGHVLGQRFMHDVGIGDQHNEAAWRRRTPDVLRWLFLPLIQQEAPAHQHLAIR